MKDTFQPDGDAVLYLRKRIHAFRRRTNREEYTDPGEAWDLLNYLDVELKRLQKVK